MNQPLMMNDAAVFEFFHRLQQANPHPRSELIYHTPFELLIAVILSAQATDKSVNQVTTQLFAYANTPATILALGQTGLENAIRTIGLYRNKAKHILVTCETLLRHYQGEVPSDQSDLESLAGVGRKTANVVRNIAFGEPTIAVDTHIFRVSNRTGLAPGKTVQAVETALLKRVPPLFQQHAHHWLILHGRYICRARKPTCNQCLVTDLCQFSEKTA